MFRKSQCDLIVPFGIDSSVKIEAGTLLMASLAHMHTDPLVFSEPDKFLARRFMEEPSLKNKLYLFAMTPHGKRKNPYGCAGYGAGFALPLFKMAISSLLTEFDWQLEFMPTFALPRFCGSGKHRYSQQCMSCFPIY